MYQHLCSVLAKIHMVTKLWAKTLIALKGSVLAKIHMVTKLSPSSPLMK